MAITTIARIDIVIAIVTIAVTITDDAAADAAATVIDIGVANHGVAIITEIFVIW